MRLQSPAVFSPDCLPIRFTCLGQNVHPPLLITDPPTGTSSFVLIFEDLDSAPRWTHWLLYNIPSSIRLIPEGIVPTGAMEGLANNNSIGYEGPCPRYFSGTHRYLFTLYAIDCLLSTDASFDRRQVEQLMTDHILARATWEISCSALRSSGVVL